MIIYPMKKLIIVYGWHLDNISISLTEERVNRVLTENGFNLSEELIDLDIFVFKNTKYANQSIETHIVIDFSNLVSGIHYYNKTK